MESLKVMIKYRQDPRPFEYLAALVEHVNGFVTAHDLFAGCNFVFFLRIDYTFPHIVVNASEEVSAKVIMSTFRPFFALHFPRSSQTFDCSRRQRAILIIC